MRLGIFLALCLLGQPAVASNIHHTKSNLNYEFLCSDVLAWSKGTSSGPVPNNVRGKMGDRLFELVNKSKRSIDISMYGVSKQDWLLSALRKSMRNGNSVRVVVDQSDGVKGEWLPENFVYSDTYKLSRYLGTKIVVPDTDRNGKIKSSFMHNKFAVFDGRTVWTGSANFSHTGIGGEYNANATLILHSAAVARVFSAEFDQMYTRNRFSTDKSPATASHVVNFGDGSKVTAAFSPKAKVIDNHLVPFIKGAKKSIAIAMFFLTDDRIVTELVAAKKRGVKVRAVLDALAVRNIASKHIILREQGIEVRVERFGGKMHMKAATRDGKDLLIGSMNWSWAGSRRNDENTLIIEKNNGPAKEFLGCFESIWKSLPPGIDPATMDPAAEGPDSSNSCSDNVDNDFDGMKDSQDPGCYRFR